MDEIINDAQNRKLRWFGHVMRMREDKIPNKMLQTKIQGKQPIGRSVTGWIYLIRKNTEMRR